MDKELFKERLREAIDHSRYTAYELAKRVNTGSSTISDYLSGKSLPKHERLVNIANELQVDPFWLAGEDGYIRGVELKKFRMLGEIACGKPIVANEEYEAYVSADSIIADYCLKCRGDSMIGAGIEDGDIVFIKSMALVPNGKIAAVGVGDEVTLKRFYYEPDKNRVTLVAENPKYPPIILEGEDCNQTRVIGLAVCVQKRI